MNGLNQLTASPHSVVLGRRTFLLAPLTLVDYGQIENRILAALPDPTAGLRQRLAGRSEQEASDELGRLFDQIACSHQITLRQLDQWWPTAAAVCYRLWLMIRKDQAWMTLEATAELIAQLGPDDRTMLARPMELCHGWPIRWPHSAVDQDAAADEHENLPWHRWAAELSQAYGWTPAEIGRLTIGQMCIYLGRSSELAGRQTMPLTEGMTVCRQRDEARRLWIRRKMEELDHAQQP